MRERLLAAIETVEKDVNYFKPANQVKEKVLQTALGKFARDCAPEDVVAFMDTTFFHSGKDGYLLSTTHFYSNLEKAKLPLAELRQVELTGKKKDHILLTCADGTATEVFGTVYAQYLYKAMSAVIATVQENVSAELDVTAPKEFHAQPTLPTDGEMAEEQRRMAQAEKDSMDEKIAIQNQIIQALQDTQRALIQKDAVAALASCERAAELGNVDGQKMAAGMYEAGKGTEVNAAKALHWYLQAAQQEDTEAQKKVAEFYFNGTGVQEDKAEALVWYKKVAEKGDATAQFNVGAMYSSGLGTAADKAEAFRWFLLAAEQGHSSAQHNVANFYRTGEGTAVNMDESFRWYLQAAEQGIAVSQFNVGSLYLGGVGTAEDAQQALYWFRKAVEQGHAQATEMVRQLEAPAEPEQEVVAETDVAVDAEPQSVTEEPKEPSVVEAESLPKSECTADEEESAEEAEVQATKETVAEQTVEELYQRGKAAIQAKEYQKGLDDLIQAGQQGHADAQAMAGYVYLKWKQDKEQAFYWYSLAAQQNNALAQLYLGEAYRTGSGVTQDYAAAAQWYQRAAEQGNANAQNNLALMYVNGWGVEKNNETALQWFQKAAAQGHAKAKEMVQRLEQQTVNEKFAKATEAYNAKDYTTALTSLKYAAKRGHGQAKDFLPVLISMVYKEAVSAYEEERYETALKCFLCLEEDCTAAIYSVVGRMYFTGQGTEKDDVEAFRWFEKGAEKGDADAQYRIGIFYANGIGTQKDKKKAFYWLSQSAEQEMNDAQYEVALMYDEGEGVTANRFEALNWYRKAAEQENKDAQLVLSVLEKMSETTYEKIGTTEELYKKGEMAVQKEEYKVATQYLELAERRGNGKASDLLQSLKEQAEEFYEKANAAFKRGDITTAKKWAEKALALGHMLALTLSVDIETFEKIQKLAEKGERDAQFQLGCMFYERRDTSNNLDEAIVWFLKAAEQGKPEAQYNIGILFKSRNWLQKAAEQGYKPAKKMLNDEWHEHWEINEDK